MFSFRVRAINFDNSREVEALVSLFQNTFGASFSLDEHLDCESLCTSCDGPKQFKDLISIVAYHQEQAVCHIGIHVNKLAEQACVVFPAVDPDFINWIDDLNKGMWMQLSKLAKRQKWKRLFVESPKEKKKQLVEMDGFLKQEFPLLKSIKPRNPISSEIEIETAAKLPDEEVIVATVALENLLEEVQSLEDAG